MPISSNVERRGGLPPGLKCRATRPGGVSLPSEERPQGGTNVERRSPLTLGAQSTSIKAVFEVQADLDPENDGLEWSTLPATRMVAGADGTLQPEPLPEDQIAAVRWTLSEPLESGEIALNSYRVRVN